MRRRALPPPPQTVGGFFVAALRHHIQSWAVVHEVLVTAFCTYLLYLKRAELTPKLFMFYPGLFSLIVAGMVAYRRSIICRSAKSYIDVGTLDDRQPLLFGEMLACLAIAAALVLVTALAGVAMAPGSVGSVGFVVEGLLLVFLAAATTVAVTFLFSGVVLRSDLPSVLSIVVIILGASRSDLAVQIHKALPFQPLVFLSQVVTPPLEEVIKCAMNATLVQDWAFVLQDVIYTALVVYGASLLLARRDVAEGKGSSARDPRTKREQHA